MAREEPVVCIPVYGSSGLLEKCISSVLQHTPASVPILIGDDASVDDDIALLCDSVKRQLGYSHSVFYFRHPTNVGFVRNVNQLFAMSAPGDVALVNTDCVVSAGWVEGLRAAARSDATVATASALTNHGTILSVPRRNSPTSRLPENRTVDDCAAAIRRSSPRARPHLPTAIGHCMYVRRSAIELVGAFDEAFSPGYGEEVDFSQRCVRHGLSHVAADDVFVFHSSAGTFGSLRERLQHEHDELIARRYPYYEDAIDTARSAIGPLSRSIAVARTATTGSISVTIDGRYLGPHLTGTQVHTLELVRGLAVRTDEVRLRVIVPDDIGAEAEALLEEVGVERVRYVRDPPTRTLTDIVHRPYQVFRGDDLRLLAQLGERIVITQQDLIAYRNPGYFVNANDWRKHRSLTQLALAVADRVVFFSEYSRQAALSEYLVDASATDVVHLGADHGSSDTGGEGSEPVVPLHDKSFLLCLGTDFQHKNRVFALKLLEQLRLRYGWTGTLVFAGPWVSIGSSRRYEAAFLESRPELTNCVIDLGSVSEGQKRWLLERSIAVLYPTLHEGFGLIPFEAASAGTPCIYASQTSLAETLPPATATIVPWDAAATADRVIRLLVDETERRVVVEAIRASAARFTWDATAAKLIDVYKRTVIGPPKPGRDVLIAKRDRSRPTVVPFDGTLSDDASSFLTAVARRPWLRAPLFGAFGLAFRVGHFARRSLSGRSGGGALDGGGLSQQKTPSTKMASRPRR